MAGYGIFSTPSVIVDGKVKCSGKVPSKNEIKKWFE
ncbi:MAG: thioredoxin family protein [Desulfobacterales bacterium]|nr:thioredoxin family protein [Desulfobacterales bacterium]